MRLLDHESAIKTLLKTNREDPEIYDHLQKMTFIFLRRKKVCRNDKDREDISFTIAGDLFMRLIQGEDFSYFLGYLDKIYKEYLDKFYEGYKDHVPFDPSIDANHEILGNPSVFDYYRLNNEVYLKEIYRVVEQLMDEACKYRRDSKEHINLRLSLVLSLIRGEVTSFHLEPEHTFYLKLLVVKFYNKVKEEGLDVDSNLCIGVI